MALGKGLDSIIGEKEDSDDNKNNTKTKTSSDSTSTDVDLDVESSDENYKVIDIEISKIIPNREQPRKDFPENKLKELVKSIQEHGVMQPVTVTPTDDGNYELIAGERRTRASKKAGLKEVPAIIRDATRQQKIELALIENIQRHDLNPVEEAAAYERLMDEFNLKQKQVANRVGKSRSTVANTIRLLNLPDKIQQALKEGKLSMGKARALLSLDSEEEQLDMFENMIGEKATVRDVENEVSKKSGRKKKRDPNIVAREKELEDKYGTKVNIKENKGVGKITFEFYSQDELKRLLKDML